MNSDSKYFELVVLAEEPQRAEIAYQVYQFVNLLKSGEPLKLLCQRTVDRERSSSKLFYVKFELKSDAEDFMKDPLVVRLYRKLNIWKLKSNVQNVRFILRKVKDKDLYDHIHLGHGICWRHGWICAKIGQKFQTLVEMKDSNRNVICTMSYQTFKFCVQENLINAQLRDEFFVLIKSNQVPIKYALKVSNTNSELGFSFLFDKTYLKNQSTIRSVKELRQQLDESSLGSKQVLHSFRSKIATEVFQLTDKILKGIKFFTNKYTRPSKTNVEKISDQERQ